MKNPEFVLEAAERRTPHEACGITLGGVAVELTNVSKTPETTFHVLPEELRPLVLASDAPWDGVWHSHPDGAVHPSTDDLAWHPAGRRLYIVASGRVFEYDSVGALLGVLDG